MSVSSDRTLGTRVIKVSLHCITDHRRQHFLKGLSIKLYHIVQVVNAT